MQLSKMEIAMKKLRPMWELFDLLFSCRHRWGPPDESGYQKCEKGCGASRGNGGL